VTFGWDRWVDAAHGLDRFGACAPGGEALDELGFNRIAVAESARRLLA
jgi:transketolase